MLPRPTRRPRPLFPVTVFRAAAGAAFTLLLLPTLGGAVGSLRAGETTAVDAKAAPPPPAPETPRRFPLSGEFEFTDSYVSDGDVRRDGRSHTLDEHNTEVRLVFTPRIPLGYLRLGVEYERYSFGLSSQAPLPNTLQSVNLVVGLDTKFSDSILFRIEAQPGIYGTFFEHLSTGDFNVPFLLGGTYIFNPNLQVIAGLSVDVNRKIPVFPGLGVRWKFAPGWVLNAVAPTPRLEYELNREVTLYAGAELKGASYRVDDRFGDTHATREQTRGRLNRAVVSFSEVRVGAGVSWKVLPTLTLGAEGGCQPYREFDFYRANARYRSDGAAAYGQFALRGTF